MKKSNFDIHFNGKCNVDYSKESASRNFEYWGKFITSKRMSRGNTKLHNMLVFDIPAVQTCLNCKTCKETCYAIKSENRYKDTDVYRNNNLHMFLNEQKTLQLLIEKQLGYSKETVVRIHGSGDFFNQDYIGFWQSIIIRNPNKRFYAYTKAEGILNFSNINKLKNFNLISSFIDGKLNYGSLEYCNMLKEKHNAFICPCGIDKTKKCGIDCLYCVTGKNVCFLIH